MLQYKCRCVHVLRINIISSWLWNAKINVLHCSASKLLSTITRYHCDWNSCLQVNNYKDLKNHQRNVHFCSQSSSVKCYSWYNSGTLLTRLLLCHENSNKKISGFLQFRAQKEVVIMRWSYGRVRLYHI